MNEQPPTEGVLETIQHVITRPQSALRSFVRTESAGGIVLMLAAAAAIIVANSPLREAYEGFLHTYVGGFSYAARGQGGGLDFHGLSVLHWINDGLMAIFFLLVGLEVKREMLDGQLSTWERRTLPGAAAAAGMIVPAVIFTFFNMGQPTVDGWAIPAATDIAFALGVLALLGKRVPGSLKVFLTAVAVIDDLGAIVIIALFYTAQLNLAALLLAAALVGVLAYLNKRNVNNLIPYLVIGLVVWVLTLASGIHATLAGVAVALTIPLKPAPGAPDDVSSPLHRLEHAIAPWVAFLIVPIFGFANAGLSFEGMEASMLISPIVLGIALGLFLGKQIGVFGIVWLLEKFDIVDYPVNASKLQVYGVALLCGIGFTMSLFIGNLAYSTDLYLDEVKLGVLGGSLMSGIVGALVLSLARNERRRDEEKEAGAAA
ncbi:Na+/H+ antiporter NhaA [Pacificimonas flava]|uniref:Na(+)/H(+) antiporter NhaA n=1 Tax=Pacificimonas flava TaxID=1234595 RepID=M2S8M5_9SPHN|nr:Na+/H+ antiporter NhaA [Pacificimonas flava]EMD81730.1 Na+/H+ antiporter NhaA type [Pacificimonas flava]MBB5279300.1 NhaA family Na+:H+ antiporter [Pacificimonas flava]